MDAENVNLKPTHLALTGRREFWPQNEPVWLVSPSCVPNPPLGDGDRTVAGVIPFPWLPDDLPAAHATMRALFDHFLSFLTERLNALHGTHHSRRYWELVVGPWLFFYVNLMTHHYTTLKMAQKQLGPVDVIGLDESRAITPADPLEFLHEATDDAYNLQLYTRLCQAMNIPIAERRGMALDERLTASDNPENLPQIRPSLTQRIMTRLLFELRRRGQRIIGPRAAVVMRRSFLPARFEWALVGALRGRVWPHEGPLFEPQRDTPLDEQARTGLAGGDGPGELGALISRFIVDDLPRVFVEDYDDLVEFAQREYGHYEPQAILSTASWDHDVAFAHFAGVRADRGARLVGGECSAIFGIEANSQILAFERAIVDLYLTWGWTDPKDPHCIPVPANRIIGLRERAQPVGGNDILYAATVALRFPVVARSDYSGYFDLQYRFFKSLPAAMRSEFRVRPHTTDYGWGTERRLRAAFPDLKIETWERPFLDSLYACRLYVLDHISTTISVALASNTPTVLFWDPVFTPLRPDVKPVFELARAAGIVHDTPESAARWVAKIYPDVDAWWFDKKTQDAVREFRRHFGRVSPTPLRDWINILNRAVSP